MRTVLVGNRALAKHVLQRMVETAWNVVGVVTPAEESSMALAQAGFEPLGDVAADYDLALVETTDINHPDTVAELAALDPDLCVCPGWSQILDETVLNVPTRGFVGFHASKLPRGRGGAPVNWSLIHGQDELWMSLFRYTRGVDAGDVIQQQRVLIEPRDDIRTVLDRLAVAARDIIDRVRVPLAEGRADATPQDIADATYRPRRQPQDGLIDWTRSADKIYDWIRAQTAPYPGAYTFLAGQQLTIWQAEPRSATTGDRQPGEVVAVVEGEGVDVATGSGLIRLKRVQPADHPTQWADEFSRRYSLSVGQRLSINDAPPGWLYTGIRDDSGGTRYPTNLSRGEQATVNAVAVASNGSPRVRVRAFFDGDIFFDRSVTVDGRATVPVEFASGEPGTHTLKIEFEKDGECVDTRYLKVFVSD